MSESISVTERALPASEVAAGAAVQAFCPAALAGHPVFLVLPGGGYGHLAEHEGRDVARWLNTRGVNAVVLRYSVAAAGRTTPLHPAPLRQARAVLAWLRSGAAGLGTDPARIGVMGFSAGGHLAATLATGVDAGLGVAQDRPELAVLGYPVISMLENAHRGSRAALTGSRGDVGLHRALSAEAAVDAATPPTFLWHTRDDAAVPVAHSLAFAAALARAAIPYELHVFPHGPHGLGLAPEHPEVAQWTRHCATWLAGHGWIPAPSP